MSINFPTLDDPSTSNNIQSVRDIGADDGSVVEELPGLEKAPPEESRTFENKTLVGVS